MQDHRFVEHLQSLGLMESDVADAGFSLGLAATVRALRLCGGGAAAEDVVTSAAEIVDVWIDRGAQADDEELSKLARTNARKAINLILAE